MSRIINGHEYFCSDQIERSFTRWRDARIEELEAEVEQLRADAERYRWLRDNATEELLYPARAGGEVPDLRTKWSMPTLICSSCIGGYMSFDESIDAARSKA